MTIFNPVVWGWDRVRLASSQVGSAGVDEYWPGARRAGVPTVMPIGTTDLRDSLERGFADFAANRTDVVFLCAIYPVVGLLLGRLASGAGMVPLLFPLASGFALLGPLVGLGLYELSRRRERGIEVGWTDTFQVLRSPAIFQIAILGTVLVVLYLLWLATAAAIYQMTLGPTSPATIGAFIDAVLTTPAGWAMIVLGMGAGFLFAALVLVTSIVSFPMLLDTQVGLETAIRTSVRAVASNPRPIALWGLIVASGLVLGSIPLLLGLAVVLPVLGHATWHLYRRLVRVAPV